MNGFDCPECGKGKVRPLAKAGRTMGFRTAAALPVPADLAIPTCDHCGEEYIGTEDAARLDAALEKVFERFVVERTQVALDVLKPHITSQELERRLGLSQGYLSKLRHDAKAPSPSLTALLMMLAADPEARLRDLRFLWEFGNGGPARLYTDKEKQLLASLDSPGPANTHPEAPGPGQVDMSENQVPEGVRSKGVHPKRRGKARFGKSG